MTSYIVPEQCGKCARLDGSVPGRFACQAFPKGIPDEIYAGTFDHRNAFKGDKGLQFVPRGERK